MAEAGAAAALTSLLETHRRKDTFFLTTIV